MISKSILVQPCLYEMVSGLKEKYKSLKLIVDTLGDQNFQFSEISRILNIPITVTINSESDMMIMASDLLVGQFARLIKDICLGDKVISTQNLELLKSSFTPTKSPFHEKTSFWFCKLSYDTWERLQEALAIEINIKNYTKVLKEQFQVFLKINKNKG